MLTIDYPRVQTTQQQNRTHLLNQLCHLSTVLGQVREHRHDLSEQQLILHEQQQALSAQKQTLLEQEERLLQEYASVLHQLTFLRE